MMSKKKEEFKCDICSKQYACVNNLYRHYKKNHQTDYQRVSYQCEYCGKKCRSRKTIKKHIKFHNRVLRKKPQLQCYVCKELFRTYDVLEDHLTSTHQKSFNIIQMQFNSFEEFKVWKSDYENKCMCRFVSNGMPYMLKDGLKRRRLKCHRTGFFKPRGNGIKNLKNIGTNKINGTCPSTMQVTEVAADNITVRVFEAHEGHDFSLKRLTLTPEERATIASQLSVGISESQILNLVKNSADIDRSGRLYLLTKKDISNIKRDFKLKNCTLIQDTEASFKAWVDQLSRFRYNPVIEFKQSSNIEDDPFKQAFILILMSEFQKSIFQEFGCDKVFFYCMNLYEIKMYVMAVAEPNGNGIPVCYGFTNQTSIEIVRYFFISIRDKVGSVRPEVFLSDDNDALFRAWCETMGPPKHQLICPRNILRIWSSLVKNKIPGVQSSGRRRSVLEWLKDLQSESDVYKLVDKINAFVQNLYLDESTKNFADHFVDKYANRVETWAFCHRRNLGFTSNMFMDDMYRRLKLAYLEGRKIKKAMKTVESALVFLRDIYLDREHGGIEKDFSATRVQLVRDCHYIALAKLTDPTISAIQSEDNRFSVTSFSDPSKSYIVDKKPSSCTCACTKRCQLCDLCIHLYVCSCSDNLINFNICKHIHFVSQKYCNNQVEAHPSSIANISDADDFADDHVLDEICDSVILHHSGLENQPSDEIQSKCKTILEMSSHIHIDEKNRKVILKHLDLAIKAMNNNQTNKISDQAVKHKSDPQEQFVQSKKKKISTGAEPLSQAVSNAIRDTYCYSNEYIINMNSGFHHTYI